jgi:hypothetical protein
MYLLLILLLGTKRRLFKKNFLIQVRLAAIYAVCAKRIKTIVVLSPLDVT